MRLSTISFGNLKRRKGKTLLLAAGLTIGVAVVVAMVGITVQMRADLEHKLDEFGANILITPRSENLSLSYGGIGVTDASYDVAQLSASDADRIKEIPNSRNISAVAPKVMGAQEIGERSVLLIGVDFETELAIKKWWKITGREPAGPSDVLLGSGAASALRVEPGSTITMGGTDYTVAGILEENASQDDIAVFAALGEAQRLLGKEGRLSLIEVSALCADCPIEDIVAQISERLPHAKVSAVRQAMALKMQTVEQVMRFSLAVSVVVLIIGSLMVFVSMMSSVNERTREIGVLRAIGFRRSHIMTVILLEAFLVSLVSGLFGWLFGSASVSFLAPRLMHVGGLSFDPAMLAAATAIALLVGMLSSVYPARKAAGLDPVEALRYF